MDLRLKGEIAYALLKYRLRKDGLSLNRDDFGREIGNLAKAIGVDKEELSEFLEIVFRELVDDLFEK